MYHYSGNALKMSAISFLSSFVGVCHRECDRECDRENKHVGRRDQAPLLISFLSSFVVVLCLKKCHPTVGGRKRKLWYTLSPKAVCSCTIVPLWALLLNKTGRRTYETLFSQRENFLCIKLIDCDQHGLGHCRIRLHASGYAVIIDLIWSWLANGRSCE